MKTEDDDHVDEDLKFGAMMAAAGIGGAVLVFVVAELFRRFGP